MSDAVGSSGPDGPDLLSRIRSGRPARGVLRNVVELANHALQGSCAATITLVNGGGPVCLAYSGLLGAQLDEVQYRSGAGPCLAAAGSNRIVEVVDCREKNRWPEYARAAVERGALSCVAVPIPVLQPGAAALTLYAAKPHAFDEPDMRLILRYGSYAAAALAYLYAEDEMRAAFARDLDAAQAGRGLINQATGILMERHRLTAEQAFSALIRASQHTNTKLREVADELVLTGAFDSHFISLDGSSGTSRP